MFDAALSLTWDKKEGARSYLRRHPLDAGKFGIDFDNNLGKYRLRLLTEMANDQDVPLDPDFTDTDPSEDNEDHTKGVVDVPDFAQEPDMPKKKKLGTRISPKKEAKVKEPKAPREPKPVPQMPDDPTGGVLVQNALITIAGLPAESSALTWAVEIAKKLRRTVEIRGASTAGLIGVIDEDYLRQRAAAMKTMRVPSPRGSRTEPGPVAKIALELALRPQGATRSEMTEANGGRQQPWTQVLKNTQALGYELTIAKDDKGRATYFMKPVNDTDPQPEPAAEAA
jgi:hypothetical protein